jgi:hypothetical protein
MGMYGNRPLDTVEEILRFDSEVKAKTEELIKNNKI